MKSESTERAVPPSPLTLHAAIGSDRCSGWQGRSFRRTELGHDLPREQIHVLQCLLVRHVANLQKRAKIPEAELGTQRVELFGDSLWAADDHVALVDQLLETRLGERFDPRTQHAPQ